MVNEGNETHKGYEGSQRCELLLCLPKHDARDSQHAYRLRCGILQSLRAVESRDWINLSGSVADFLHDGNRVLLGVSLVLFVAIAPHVIG